MNTTIPKLQTHDSPIHACVAILSPVSIPSTRTILETHFLPLVCTHFTLDPLPHLKSPSSDAACRADSRSCTEEEQKDRGAENADLDDNDGGGEEEGEGVDFVALPRPPSRDASILHLILHAHTVKRSFFFCLLGWAGFFFGGGFFARAAELRLPVYLPCTPKLT